MYVCIEMLTAIYNHTIITGRALPRGWASTHESLIQIFLVVCCPGGPPGTGPRVSMCLLFVLLLLRGCLLVVVNVDPYICPPFVADGRSVGGGSGGIVHDA